ncbi:MAG: hypothetical protein LBG24_04830 [Treponema sp.]|nr:hypothetical protein [Treponema sp.]
MVVSFAVFPAVNFMYARHISGQLDLTPSGGHKSRGAKRYKRTGYAAQSRRQARLKKAPVLRRA